MIPAECRSVEELLELIGQDRGELKFYFFWGHKARGDLAGPWCLSQWFGAPFEVDGERFETAEHFMMAGKARLFGDEETRARILKASHPGEAKKLGRAVRGFDEARWADCRQDIVVEGNVAKFSQHPELSGFLLTTGTSVIVEASPRDRIWGIGLSAKDGRATDPFQWRGKNLLGFALMEARSRLSEGGSS